MSHAGMSSWIIFHAIIIFLLAMDLGVLNKNAHVIRMKEALFWSVIWIILGLGFGGYIYWQFGSASAAEYVTGYIVEKSLSVDNLFVFAVIFSSFAIERKFQHRLLFWGILGAILLRGVMIFAGTELLQRFHWLIQVFGAFLLLTGLKLLLIRNEKEKDPTKNIILRIVKKILPFTDEPHEGHLIKRTPQGIRFTTFFAALVVVETSDVIFALDSVPAVFGVTKDPFIVYTSNIFAILGLRSLFFVLEELLVRFHLLKIGLSLILIYVGVKMLLEKYLHISPWLSLGIIAMLLGLSIVMSFVIKDSKLLKAPGKT